MSLSSKAAMALLRALQPSKGSFTDYEACLKRAEKENSSFRFSMPRSRRAQMLLVPGFERECLVIRPHERKSTDKAVLYLYGGVTNSWHLQKSMALKFALDSGLETWYPVYPACTEVPLKKTTEYLVNVYREMTKHFEADRIIFNGVSMGGYHALGIVSMINHENLPLPVPALLFAHSPGGTPDNEADWDEMRRYAEKDPLFSEADLRMTERLMPDGINTPDWLLTPAHFDFRRAPETCLFFGEEMLAGNAVTYRRAFENSHSGERVHIEIEPDMMHGYSCLPVFPESRKAYQKTMDLIAKL